MESILQVLLDVPFWCSFRDPTSVNVHTTFRLPPPTTLYGLVANALGLPQDDYSLRTQLQFAVGIERQGQLVETYSKIMKVREAKTPEEAAKPGNFYISTAVIRQKLIQPAFWMYLLADKERVESVCAALLDPARPLYLGESDDVVDVASVEIVASESVKTAQFHCAVHGMKSLSNGEQPVSIANLPYHFTLRGKNDWGVQRRLYMFRLDNQTLTLAKAETAYNVSGKHVMFEPAVQEIVR